MPDSENWPLHCVEEIGVTGREMDLCQRMGVMSGVTLSFSVGTGVEGKPWRGKGIWRGKRVC